MRQQKIQNSSCLLSSRKNHGAILTDGPAFYSTFCLLLRLLIVILHSPHNSGDLAAGQGVVGLIGAGAIGEVALNDAGGIQRLHIDVIGIGKGLLAGQTGGRKLQRRRLQRRRCIHVHAWTCVLH